MQQLQSNNDSPLDIGFLAVQDFIINHIDSTFRGLKGDVALCSIHIQHDYLATRDIRHTGLATAKTETPSSPPTSFMVIGNNEKQKRLTMRAAIGVVPKKGSDSFTCNNAT